ncbi:MAG: penicillin-binding protein activator [Cocleimonas sp.]|nr:penicillin-binding protein activator [Cocleimonas sp.]
MICATKGPMARLFSTSFLISLSLLALSACTSLPSIGNIVPQIALPTLDNHALPQGKDIELANALLAAGKKREAAAAYFDASRNYRSPERERLILQASELAAISKDSNLAQRYLSPLRYSSLNKENQARFRFTQAQLALNDKNYRETLRILPQRVQGLPDGLASKILNARMRAAQSSRDRISLVQELVLQEPTLKNDYEVKLNHDRIWNHIQQIPRGKLNESRKHINHAVLRSWLDLGYLARTAKGYDGAVTQSARSNILSWQQRNRNHPGNSKVAALLKSAPATTTTPYKASSDKTSNSSHTGTQIAVILPLTGRLSSVGNTILQGIKEAHKQSSSNTHLKVYNSANSSIQGLYKVAVDKGADLIVGPFDKNKIYSLAKANLDKPVLGLNYVLDSNTSNPKLKQFGLLPEDEAVQMAQFALNQGHKRVALLTPNSAWGQRLRDAMRTAVIERGGTVVIMKSYLNNAKSYFADAQNLAFRSDEIDTILMAASPSQAQRLYPALRQEIKRLPIYATSHVFSGVANASTDSNLEGLIFTETPWVLDMIKNNSNAQSNSPRLHALGMDAYLIAKNLNKLQGFSGSLNGKTGRIRLSQDGTMHRTLRWAQFRNGIPVAIR